MKRARPALVLALLGCASAATGVGVTHAAFSGQASNPGNAISAAPDFQAPAIADVAIIRSGGTANFIPSAATYRVYANVTDGGNPSSGLATVTANVSSVTAGQTAVALGAGSFTVNGITYNRRSALLTAGVLPNGARSYSVNAVDGAANSAAANATVTIDSTAPAGADIQTANAAGGIAGRAGTGDSITYTFSEPVQADSILAGWTGAATPVDVRLRNGGGPTGDRVDVWSGGQTVALGTVGLARSDFLSGSAVWFDNSTMTMSGSTVTIVLAAPLGSPLTAGGPATMHWTPSVFANDRAGNIASSVQAAESGPVDRDF